MGADESSFIHSREQFKVYTCSCLNRQNTWPGNEHTKAQCLPRSRALVAAPLVTRGGATINRTKIRSMDFEGHRSYRIEVGILHTITRASLGINYLQGLYVCMLLPTASDGTHCLFFCFLQLTPGNVFSNNLD